MRGEVWRCGDDRAKTCITLYCAGVLHRVVLTVCRGALKEALNERHLKHHRNAEMRLSALCLLDSAGLRTSTVAGTGCHTATRALVGGLVCSGVQHAVNRCHCG